MPGPHRPRQRDCRTTRSRTPSSAHAGRPDPFETARTRLLFGARLRRDGQRVAAREQLRVAHDAFTEMDLTHWARPGRRRARRHRRHRATPRRRHRRATHLEETRVALLVAEGMSNREVAAALFLSPKTIERHLGSVFRKRGFRSRTQLARAYATGEPTGRGRRHVLKGRT